MRTDDLIASLGAELSPLRPGILRRSVAAGLGAGAVLSVAAFAALWGVRPDLTAALGAPFVAAKTGLPLVLAGLALPAGLAAARPGGWSRAGAALVAVPALLLALVAAGLAVTPSGRWGEALMGQSVATCLVSIPLLSAPLLAGLLAGLRRGAPIRPARCGAVAGLVAGGAGAALYSLFCTEDSPLFYGLWYTLAIAGVTAAAALAGARILRW